MQKQQIIKQIKLINFRCYEQFKMEFKKTTTVIVGGNGSGKTSIIEAIYLLLKGTSFKGLLDDQVKHGKDFYKIELKMDDGEKRSLYFVDKKKIFNLGGETQRKITQKHRFPVVLFLAEDLGLVGGAPNRRRDYLDEIIKQIDDGLRVKISRYKRALEQRNKILKLKNVRREDLFSWNVLCANYGTDIRKAHQEMIREINKKINQYYQKIADNKDKIEIRDKTEVIDANTYLQRLEENFEKDKILGFSNYGVHRDDYEFRLNGEKADGRASRGETRSIVIALKFIETEILKERLKQKPLVLLDDIFSELDEKRQKGIMDNFKDYQVIITSTSAPIKEV